MDPRVYPIPNPGEKLIGIPIQPGYLVRTFDGYYAIVIRLAFPEESPIKTWVVRLASGVEMNLSDDQLFVLPLAPHTDSPASFHEILVKAYPPNFQGHGRYSVERLVHYQCGNCDQWFSIGDAPPDLKRLFCPKCGQYQNFKETTSGVPQTH